MSENMNDNANDLKIDDALDTSESTKTVETQEVEVAQEVIAEVSSENNSNDDKVSQADKSGKKDKKDKKDCKTCDSSNSKKTTIGGQALIEGIMMCGPKRTCMAVRKGDGTIHIEEVVQSDRVSFFEKVPFIRGCIKFYKMLVTGTGAIMKSAEISEEGLPEDEKSKENKAEVKKSRLDKFLEKHYNLALTCSAILGILLSVGLFILLPRAIVDLALFLLGGKLSGTLATSILWNCVEGVLRIAIFLIYLSLVSKMPDIARVWQYHGAEHKTIACYEARQELTVENIKKHVRFHPRCGTAFMFIVLMISILVYTIIGAIIGDQNPIVNIAIRIIFIPIICGIAYEILRFVGRHSEKGLCKVLCKPGLWLQKFTTREPDDKMIEVAICAMQAVIPENDNDDNW